MKKQILAITCFVAMVGHGQLNADLTIGFSTDGGISFIQQHALAVGESVKLDVFLRDSESGGALETDGLFGFGLRGITSNPLVGAIENSTINPIFDLSTDGSTESEIVWDGGILVSDIPVGQNIYLGSFDFVSASVGVSELAFSDLDPGGGSENANWVTASADILDELIFDPALGGQPMYSLTMVAVPEPSTWHVFVSLGLFAASNRRRSRIV